MEFAEVDLCKDAILDVILPFLKYADICVLSRVNKYLNYLIEREEFWERFFRSPHMKRLGVNITTFMMAKSKEHVSDLNEMCRFIEDHEEGKEPKESKMGKEFGGRLFWKKASCEVNKIFEKCDLIGICAFATFKEDDQKIPEFWEMMKYSIEHSTIQYQFYPRKPIILFHSFEVSGFVERAYRFFEKEKGLSIWETDRANFFSVCEYDASRRCPIPEKVFSVSPKEYLRKHCDLTFFFVKSEQIETLLLDPTKSKVGKRLNMKTVGTTPSLGVLFVCDCRGNMTPNRFEIARRFVRNREDVQFMFVLSEIVDGRMLSRDWICERKEKDLFFVLLRIAKSSVVFLQKYVCVRRLLYLKSRRLVRRK